MANLPLKLFVILLSILLSGCGDVDTTVSSITVSPSAATIGISHAQLFSAVVKNSIGQIIAATPTWSTVGGVGSVNSSGIFMAGSSTGEGTVTATYGGYSGSATVTVTSNGWVDGRVIDSKGYKVPDLKVYLKEITSLFDLTDSNGDYSIASVPAGTYEVFTLQTSVYRSSSDEVTVSSGETETVNFTILYFTDPPDLTPPEYSYE